MADNSNECPKCSEEIILGVMEIHEKKIVICSNCDTKWEVVMHGDRPLFEEVKAEVEVMKEEEPKIAKEGEKKGLKSSPFSKRGGR